MRPITMTMAQKQLETIEDKHLYYPLMMGATFPVIGGKMNLAVYGYSNQLSTPSPSSPVTIDNMKDVYITNKSLVRETTVVFDTSPAGLTISNGNLIVPDTTVPDASCMYYGTPFFLKTGDVLTASFKGTLGRALLVVALIPYELNPLSASNYYTVTDSRIVPQYSVTGSVSFTINTTGVYRLGVYVAYNQAAYTYTNWGIQLEFGSTTDGYEARVKQIIHTGELKGIECDSWHDYNVTWNDGSDHYAITDSVEPYVNVSGVLKRRTRQRIAVKVFDGTETITMWTSSVNNGSAGFYYSDSTVLGIYGTPKFVTTNHERCTHFYYTGVHPISTSCSVGTLFTASTSNPPYIAFRAAFTTVTAFKAWLAAQYSAGTPVTVYYALVDAVDTLSTAVSLPPYRPVTNILSEGWVKGQIAATALTRRE